MAVSGRRLRGARDDTHLLTPAATSTSPERRTVAVLGSVVDVQGGPMLENLRLTQPSA